MATTLFQLRERAKSESDNVGQGFVSDAEWNEFIGQSYLELYGLVTEAYGNDYNVQSPNTGYTFTTDGVNQFFALPTNFFKLLGVDLQITGSAGNWVSLKPFTFGERNSLSNWNSSIPMAGQVIRLFYVPKATLPVLDNDTIEGVNGWEEYVVVDAAIKAMAKEESDVSVLMARKKALIARLNSETQNRDSGEAVRISLTRGRRNRTMKYRLNGNQIWLIGNSYLPFEQFEDGSGWDDGYGTGW